MIQKISEIFKFDSEFLRFLKKSSLSKDNQVFDQEEIEFLLQFMTKDKNLREFFEFYSNSDMQTYNIKMKMLIITHQFIHSNEEFSKLFTSLRLTNFSLLKHSHRNYEAWLLTNIQIPFLSYLQKLAISFKEIKSYKTSLFRKSNYSNLMIDSFKMVNLVNMALSLVPNLKIALKNYPQDRLLQKLTFNIYQEIQGYQKNLINAIIILLNENSKNQSVDLYEFLRELKVIEQKMISYHQFRSQYDPKAVLKSPSQIQIFFENQTKCSTQQNACKAKTKREFHHTTSRSRQSTGEEATTPKSQRLLYYCNHKYSSCAQLLLKDQEMVIQEESEKQIDQTLQQQ
ncbi:unnamed protein product (macronuclear) [Paramecium tetraurelia]|uniref:Uncharacterized protein n=1 Tax=Paramecium tetraurelia TaxID=5888 RepID=A0EBL3_PARTE|nr:uncharacterized protein GSPATT00025414001 [Paramecium tetraurelia]CAK92680.1 unnamed protein product [Paramecium tetraurelia]|eukprot:XP_001460077.1 hypothetical protein (macronuclear) [Paramecium tetraurelia strain d4-2]